MKWIQQYFCKHPLQQQFWSPFRAVVDGVPEVWVRYGHQCSFCSLILHEHEPIPMMVYTNLDNPDALDKYLEYRLQHVEKKHKK